jgi:hypothetical protein
MDIITSGYKLPFNGLPPKYMENNNASCERNCQVVSDLVFEMADLGIFSFVDEQQHCVSPLGLVNKETPSGVKHSLFFCSGILHLPWCSDSSQ